MSPPLATSAPPARPWALRGYATLVVGLAAFLAAMVVLRVPFRGYLVEGRVSGCLDASLTEADLRGFLKEAAADIHKRIDIQQSGRCEVVFQQLAPRAGDSQAAINRIARQLSEQFVAQRREAGRQVRLARYQAELRTARDAEDGLRIRLEQLREEQLAQARQAEPPLPFAAPLAPADPAAVADEAARQRLMARLESLKNDLLRLLATKTEEHPEVITLRSQISRLQVELAPASPSPGNQATRPVSTLGLTAFEEDGLGTQLDDAAADLLAATRARQWAERQLQAQVESQSSITAVPWSFEAAQVTSRVGGTPRVLTLIGAGLVTLLAAGIMFRAAPVLTPKVAIESVEDLAALLALPLAGHTPAPISGRLQRRPGRLHPLAVRIGLHAAELFLAVMVAALLFTMLADRSLAPQVLIDPFGVLSEVTDRMLA